MPDILPAAHEKAAGRDQRPAAMSVRPLDVRSGGTGTNISGRGRWAKSSFGHGQYGGRGQANARQSHVQESLSKQHRVATPMSCSC